MNCQLATCKKAFRCGVKELLTTTSTHNERPLAVRQRKTNLRARVNGDLRVEFTESGLTSYAGLELLIRYFRSIRLSDAIRRHLGSAGLASDYGIVAMVRLFLGLLIVGGRRLMHVEFVRGDALFGRFCGLRCLPSARTLSRWLKRFKRSSVRALQALNAEIVGTVVDTLRLHTVTVDVDGSVVSTGLQVDRAFRGYNPHHRKIPSYYPITAFLAETGHVLRVQNRSGNVHDGKSSIPFLRDLFAQVDETLGAGYRLNFRMDAAFFSPTVLRLLRAKGAGYAIKVPFWHWLEITRLIQDRQRWHRVCGGVSAFEKTIPAWGMDLRVVIYRKKVHHKTRKNYQLDLFDPNNGYYEYSAVATNLTWNVRRLWNFVAGRGLHEKVIGQLKSHLAFDTIPTNHYGANSAWQLLVALAHNLLVNFQIHTGCVRRHRTEKRTTLYPLKTVQTLRFEVFNRAGRIARPQGATLLRLGNAGAHKLSFIRLANALKAA